MKKFLNLVLFGLSFIWQLPQNLVAIIMLPFLGKLKIISYKKLCFAFEGKNMSGGISLGNFTFLSNYLAKDKAAIAHEQEGHTMQSKILGPLYLLIIGIPSILHAWLGDDNKCYYDFYTESSANYFCNLEVKRRLDGGCYLQFKN